MIRSFLGYVAIYFHVLAVVWIEILVNSEKVGIWKATVLVSFKVGCVTTFASGEWRNPWQNFTITSIPTEIQTGHFLDKYRATSA
jgi:hypothetical protein